MTAATRDRDEAGRLERIWWQLMQHAMDSGAAVIDAMTAGDMPTADQWSKAEGHFQSAADALFDAAFQQDWQVSDAIAVFRQVNGFIVDAHAALLSDDALEHGLAL